MIQKERSISEDTLRSFAASLRGQLIHPADASYNDARAVWNGIIDKHPAFIARCTCTSDVVTAVNFARDHSLLVAVRGGGHNVAGSAVCDGGLVIDLSAMKQIEVDATARLVRAGGGVTWGELDMATQAFGLAVPGGLVSDTGIAGLTLGGGLGWLRRKYGLSSDNLIRAEVVTAGGQVVTASEADHADLFWGLRGGGGNFGVVTSFTYRLHPVEPAIMLAFVFYPRSLAQQALTFYREYNATTPDEVSSFAILGTIPSTEIFPREIHGQPYVLFAAVYAGSVEDGERVLRPLREFATPLHDLSAPLPYVEVQKLFDEDYPAHIMRYYWKSLYLQNLNDEVIAHLITNAKACPSSHSTTDIWQMGGAIGHIDEYESAYSNRHAPFLLGVEANWEKRDEDEKNINWVRDFIEDMLPYSDGSSYLNFPGFMEKGTETLQKTFGAKYARLAEVKKQYDPTNLFRVNLNIQPL
jgi:FAD/FMN-containing dehydrogenase